VPTEMLTRDEHRRVEERPQPVARSTRPDELRMAARRYAARMRRLKLSAAVWGVWTILITTLWVVHEWDVNGAFELLRPRGRPRPVEPRAVGARGRDRDADRRDHGGEGDFAIGKLLTVQTLISSPPRRKQRTCPTDGCQMSAARRARPTMRLPRVLRSRSSSPRHSSPFHIASAAVSPQRRPPRFRSRSRSRRASR
jgi:hypothetical protein